MRPLFSVFLFSLVCLASVSTAGLHPEFVSAKNSGIIPLGKSEVSGVKAAPVKCYAGGVDFCFEVGDIQKASRIADNGEYALLGIDGAGFSTEEGQPQLPVIRRVIEVPEGARLSVSHDGVKRRFRLKDLDLPAHVMPRQAPLLKIHGASEKAQFKKDPASYGRDVFMPLAPVRISEEELRFAGRRLVVVEVSPVLYNPVKGEFDVYSEISVSVCFEGGQKSKSVLSSREEELLGSIAENFSSVGRKDAGSVQKESNRLLVIAHDSFVAGMSSYVAHKQGRGWTVDLAGTSVAGTTKEAIRSYVISRYTNLVTRPDALLLVGDTAQIPQFITASLDNPDTDIYYACMDSGSDWYPEFPVGRFSVSSSAQLTAVANKTMEYESAPGGDWIWKAAFMAGNDNHAITEATHNYCIANYMDAEGYTSQKLYSWTYSATPAQVSAAFNQGRALGVYSGHGDVTLWADGPEFLVSNVNALTNSGRYPMVLSFACLTGDYSASECFAETWLRGAGKACVNMWASSTYSYWDEDDILQKGFFAAVCNENVAAFGEATLQAKNKLLNYYGANSTIKRYFEMYNVFGDPTVSLRRNNFTINNSGLLELGYLNEPYSAALLADGGAEPYTNWTVSAGTLPSGLLLDRQSGIISGTPSATGSNSFSVQLVDSLAAVTNAQLHVNVVRRLVPASPALLPDASQDSAYTATLSASGGTAPYTWALNASGKYGETETGGSWTGGGTAKGWQGDNASWQLILPWTFTFFGENKNSLWVSSNGYIDFGGYSTNPSPSVSELKACSRIAVLWDDLALTDAGEGIYTKENSESLTIRWVGHTVSGSFPVDFELVLFKDGRMQFNYGPQHEGLNPVIGVSKGNSADYTLSALSGSAGITAMNSRLFSIARIPAGLSLSSAGVVSGTPAEWGEFVFWAAVTDSGVPVQTVDQQINLAVALTNSVLKFSSSLYEASETNRTVTVWVERMFALNTAVSVDFSTSNGTAVAGADFVARTGTLSFAPGEVRKGLYLQVIDDPVPESTEEFFVNISNPGGSAMLYYPRTTAVRLSSDEATGVLIYGNTLDASPGWPCQGGWAFGVPQGQGGALVTGDGGAPDPNNGFTGNNVYGYNLSGNYGTLAAPQYMTMGPVDCRGYGKVELRFKRWLGVGKTDNASIRVTKNMTSFLTVWQSPDVNLSDGDWVDVSCDISAVADNQMAVYVQWGMGAADTTNHFCGWNIDDIEVRGTPLVPSASILSPYGASEVVQHQQVLLQGCGWDYTGNAVTSLTWLSNIDGQLGTGSCCEVGSLSSGSHNITLRVVDSGSRTGTVSVALNVLADAASNGLPDAWEATYWPVAGSGGGSNDSDGDGLSNYEEWIAQTDPTNAASCFTINTVETSGQQSGTMIRWPGVVSRTYDVFWYQDLFSEPELMVSGIAGESPFNTFLDTVHVDSDNGFYRIRVNQP